MSQDASTPLGCLIRDLIRQEGPIGLDRYMALALGHPALGYYMTRDPLGQAGDFTTAPEISQMFGEMIGLWLAELWERLGSPTVLRLVELGPGRGTLMADVLRVSRIRPAFRAALDVHLVETSPVLRERQAKTLAETGLQTHWHSGFDTVPDGPALVVANEFFDALPIRHFQRTLTGWHERLIGLDAAEQLCFGLAPEPEPRLTQEAPPGSILEVGVAAQAAMLALARRVAGQGGAALIIDYGHVASGLGESLQAVRQHRFADPLAEPGNADLTAHVDFEALGRMAKSAGAAVHGPVEQGTFLLGLGIAERAAALGRSRPDQVEQIRAALQRLIEPDSPRLPGMGRLFKVLGLTSPGLDDLPGFATLKH